MDMPFPELVMQFPKLDMPFPSVDMRFPKLVMPIFDFGFSILDL
jgi:hypothetical protein